MAWACIIEPHALTAEVVTILVDALYRIDLDFLRRFPDTPELYQTGVRYQREEPGRERWAGIHTVLALGHGDCEDLACWRAAELVLRDKEPAKPIVQSRWTPDGMLYHIVVLRADGSIEDPSKRLGMNHHGAG